ncbi:MAG: LLM class flavin-dependent oxidoreductase [Acidimicrobiales bacterium]|jgi:probable F420-dependent oxidoreductase|nr:LLM class flavin-dependent oxidoreductase [Acidimicrobiales bacterium]|tara:strand:- start:4943 stop:5815 length:873 start_codon:yes stop_codon:yes gene_type:complete
MVDKTGTPIGVMFNTDRMSAASLTGFAQHLESLSVDTLWVPELFGREPFATAAHLLAATTRLRVATGIANVYARDAVAAAAGARTLAEFSDGRFVLGLGVSNARLANSRGHVWEPPVEKLTSYITAIREAQISVPGPHEAEIHVAAHGPKMLEAVNQLVDGISTFLQTPEHTAAVRQGIPESTSLNVTQMCLLCDDPAEARRLARRALSFYVELDYYRRAWRNLGFDELDFVDGGSDHLVDALVAWGSPDAILERLGQHGDAGATELVIIPLNPVGGTEPHLPLLEELAP